MYLQPIQSPNPYILVPAKVQAAQNYLHFAFGVRAAAINHHQMPGDAPTEAELANLSSREQAVYDAALDVLRLYFAGEMDYGDPLPGHRPPDDPPPPEEPKPSPVT